MAASARTSGSRSIRWKQEFRSDDSRVFKDEDLSSSGWLYHYLEYPHALAIFTENRLRLVHPARWSDPYERWWWGAAFGKRGPQGSVYALSWNRNRRDESAWRIAGFGRTNPIVRIRCRVRDIMLAAQATAEQRTGTFYMGHVAYEREEALRKRATAAQIAEKEKGKDKKDFARPAANLLLRKREAFKFEKEVRTLWLDQEPQNTALFIPIEAATVVKQVMCSPFAHPDQQEQIRREFKERFAVDVTDAPIVGALNDTL